METGIPPVAGALATHLRPEPGRSALVDLVRGIAILLVVLGHAIQRHTVAFDASPLFRAIYSFHMPLFIAVSGYLAYGRLQRGFGKTVRRKTLQLVVPFLSWYVVAYLVTSIGNRTLVSPVSWVAALWASPDNGLWFLWVLFLCFVIAAAVAGLRPRGGAAPAIVGGLSLAGWLALLPYWRRTGELPVETVLRAAHVPGARFAALGFRYVVAALGITACVALTAAVLGLVKRPPKHIVLLGAMTMDVHVSHQYFTGLPSAFGPVWIFVGFALGLAGSLGLSTFVLRRSAPTRVLLLGLPEHGATGVR